MIYTFRYIIKYTKNIYKIFNNYSIIKLLLNQETIKQTKLGGYIVHNAMQ